MIAVAAPVSVGSVYEFGVLTEAGVGSLHSANQPVDFALDPVDAPESGFFTLSGANTLLFNADAVIRLAGQIEVFSTAQRNQATITLNFNGIPTGTEYGSSYTRNSGTAYDYWTLPLFTRPFTVSPGDQMQVLTGSRSGGTKGNTGTQTHRVQTAEITVERIA
ncbi:MAG: hypothetical protein AAF583_01575 [Pseudomonadota bacterium]